MLNAEDNKLLTDISPGSPMGDLMRQYWMPVMLSEELLEADGNPVRLTVLCENLVIFRDTGGRIGLFSEYCPHRRASLYYGRNEEGGLRCLYHGWKFDVTGQCLDMPNEPPESNFKNKLRQVAYPCREAAGMIWAYMGPRETPPPLPEFEWMSMPAEQRQISPFLRECNWMQALEGDIDTTHSGFLHSQLERGASAVNTWRREHPPRMEVVQTPAGVMYGGRYGEIEPDDPDGNATTYWRISQFMFPFHTLFPARPDGLVPGHIWVPLDNGNTMVYAMGWNPVRPMESAGDWRARTRQLVGEYLPQTSEGLGRWRAKANRSNDYMQDRALQRSSSFSGIPTVPLQDQAMTEPMGPVLDRTQEHLGAADAMIIQTRQRLIKAAKAFRDTGEPPPGVDNPDWFRLRSASATLPVSASWTEELKDWMEARTTVIPGVGLPSPT